MAKIWFGSIALLATLHLTVSQDFHNCGSYDGARYPDPRSCYNYYECHNGVSIRKVCSFGMVYNCFFKFCTFKAFAPCCRYDPNPTPTENGCLNLGIKIPNPFICNKYFECKNWNIVERTCPAGERFDFLRMSCVDSRGCRCAPGTVIDNTTETTVTQRTTSEMTTMTTSPMPSNMPTETSPAEIVSTTMTSTSEATTSPIPTETSTENPISEQVSTTVTTELTSPETTPATNVPTEPSTSDTGPPQTSKPIMTTTSQSTRCPINGVKFPDTKSCTKYYQCQNGVFVLKTCRYGFFYNCFLQRCAIFTFTPCCKDDPYPVSNNEYCTNLGKKVPNPYDCTKYFECRNYMIQEFSCPQNELFDWVQSRCVAGDTCQCIPGSGNEPQGTTGTEASSQSETTNPWVEWINTTTAEITTAAEDTTTKTCLECSSFTTIEDTTTTSASSPQNIVTNPETTTSGAASSDSTAIISTTETPSSNKCPYNGVRFPDTRTCKNYYECSNGQPIKKTCPMGLVFNCFLQICTFRAFTPCCKYDPTLPPYDDTCLGLEIKVPNPFECNKYYQCKEFKIVEETCPARKKYDWIKMDCVDARNCHCAPGL